MKICAVSDLHGFYPEIQECDLLIMAGDCTYTNDLGQWVKFFKWFKNTPAKNRILVAGNHDDILFKNYASDESEMQFTKDINLIEGDEIGFHYLNNWDVEIEGLKIWGSPCTPHFPLVRPEFSYFMYRHDGDPWEKIPENLDILITHGPPYGILDDNSNRHRVGCRNLLKQVKRANPKIHIFGHIHEAYGNNKIEDTHFYNVAINDENYIPSRKPTYIEI